MVPRRAEEAQNGARSGPKPPQEEPKKVKKANPNGKTKKGPNQDDPKTILDRITSDLRNSPTPPGAIWEAKTVPKSTPKRSKIEAKIQDEKKAIQDDLGPVLERSWVDLGPILGSILSKNHGKT